MTLLDPSAPEQARAESRLRSDTVGWLSTVSADGVPQSTPVWFWWDGQSVLLFSQPHAPKVANIRQRSSVGFHLNSDEEGEDVFILEGDAEILADGQPAAEVSGYVEKYREGMAGLDMTPESFSELYSVPIRITPTRFRAW